MVKRGEKTQKEGVRENWLRSNFWSKPLIDLTNGFVEEKKSLCEHRRKKVKTNIFLYNLYNKRMKL